MAWSNEGNGSRIPDGIKRQVRADQNNQCNTIDPSVCTGHIDEFDHIINVKTLRVERPEANDRNNIQGLCSPCHKIKTQREAQAARRRKYRRPYRHPGLE